MHPSLLVQFLGVGFLLWLCLPNANPLRPLFWAPKSATLRIMAMSFYFEACLISIELFEGHHPMIPFIAITGISGLGFLTYGAARGGLLRRLQDTPVSKIGAAAIGPVSVQGNAWPSEPLHSLFNKTPVVYYYIEALRFTGDGYYPIKHQTWNPRFFLADETGMAVVGSTEQNIEGLQTFAELSGAALSGEQRARIQIYFFPFLKEKFALEGIALEECFTSKFLFREYFIPVGAPMFVAAYFQSFADYVRPFREENLKPFPGANVFVNDVKFFRDHPTEAIASLDRNHDGRISEQEWYAGYQRMAKAASGDFGFQPMPAGAEQIKDIRCAGALVATKDCPLVLSPGTRAQGIASVVDDWNFLRILGGTLMIALAIYDLAHFYGR